jgi:DNA topoisomerase-3
VQHAIRGNQYVKNYEFDFNFGDPWGNCSVTMTSVIGHLTGLDFERQYKGWMSCPPGSLFEAPVQEAVDKVRDESNNSVGYLLIPPQDKLPIAENIRNQARYSKALFIWTDCDREGEHIGSEVRNQARSGNSRIEVKRARFSNTERA